ncbi:MAG: N-acetylmuramoyl-L-alanine amidase [Truepera sp.]|jgi:N-acetylmuramoyl-L-alanine amidase|nr:N-acetylmuramoyl-L-alanine amidase [Truepera sp.]
MRPARTLLLVLLALLAAVAGAEPRLLVNGREIAGNTTSLVSGTSYAPGSALARALGADLTGDAGRGLVTLQAGGRVLQLTLVEEAGAAPTPAVWLDGRDVPGGPAVSVGGEIFLPVKPVAEALGASVTYLSSEDTVMVVQPRGRLSAMRLQDSGTERIELSLSAPVRYTTFYNEPLSTLFVYLDRTDVEARLDPLEGKAFKLATATSQNGATEVRVQLEPGTNYLVYAVPDGRGFRLNLSFDEAGEAPATRRVSVVLDPGHGGDDLGVVSAGLGSESTLTLAFAKRLAAALEGRGMQVQLTRQADAPVDVPERSRAGIGADLFISIHSAALDLGEFRVYYLGDANNVTSLEMAVRENAAQAARQDETDAIRRKILLGLVPDLDIGRRVAEAISERLFAVGGYRAESITSAPLQVLGGAAGRGVLFEFAAADLASEGLPERFADALEQLVRDGSIGLPR